MVVSFQANEIQCNRGAGRSKARLPTHLRLPTLAALKIRRKWLRVRLAGGLSFLRLPTGVCAVARRPRIRFTAVKRIGRARPVTATNQFGRPGRGAFGRAPGEGKRRGPPGRAGGPGSPGGRPGFARPRRAGRSWS